MGRHYSGNPMNLFNRRAFLKQSSIVAAGIGAGLVLPWQERPVIRTLVKDVAPDEVSGAVLFHEHLSMHYPLTNALAARQGVAAPTHFSDDVDLMIAETREAGRDGVGC